MKNEGAENNARTGPRSLGRLLSAFEEGTLLRIMV